MGAKYKGINNSNGNSNSNGNTNSNGNGNSNGPPPFLTKTYEMVDDPLTDQIVSWSDTNSNSFVVWNLPHFSQDVLPLYFKHNNFSSFVRQLNTYGFHKIDPDRWEFANDGFTKGNKESLKYIHRRKPQLSQLQRDSNASSHSAILCNDSRHLELEEQIHRLKHDKSLMVSELFNLRRHQKAAEMDIEILGRRIEALEDKHEKVIRFLAQVMKNPGTFMELMQNIAHQYDRSSASNLDAGHNTRNIMASPSSIKRIGFDAKKRGRSGSDILENDCHLEADRAPGKVAKVFTEDPNIYMDSSASLLHEDILADPDDGHVHLLDVGSICTHDHMLIMDTGLILGGHDGLAHAGADHHLASKTVPAEDHMMSGSASSSSLADRENLMMNLQLAKSAPTSVDVHLQAAAQNVDDDDDDDANGQDGEPSPQSEASGVTATHGWERVHLRQPMVVIADDHSQDYSGAHTLLQSANHDHGIKDTRNNNTSSILSARTHISNDNFWENLLTESPHIVN